MHKKIDIFRIAKVMIPLWVIIQLIIIVIYWDSPLTGDTIIYHENALASFEQGLWYPNDLNSIIVAEPLINSLIAQLKLFGTLNTNKIVNLIMNIGILICIFTIAKKLFNERVAYISCILFCLIYSNTLIVIGTRTELPFVLFLLLALAVLKPVWWNVMLAGIFMGVAEWYRPLMPVFIPGLILYMFYEKFEKKYYVIFLVALIASVACIGVFNYQQTGKYFVNPSTGGANLFMTANDKAFGGTATHLLRDSDVVPPMPEEYNALQKDSVYKVLAKDWIKEHPVNFATLYVKKLGLLFVEDSWPDRAVMQNSGKLSMYITEKDYGSLLGVAVMMVAKSVIYYIVLIIFVISIVRYRKELLSKKGTIVLTLILGTLATCLFVVSPTYHYPYMFAIIIWAAYAIDKELEKHKIIEVI